MDTKTWADIASAADPVGASTLPCIEEKQPQGIQNPAPGGDERVAGSSG
ncbi:hypothetical protein [Streptomyces collinus]